MTNLDDRNDRDRQAARYGARMPGGYPGATPQGAYDPAAYGAHPAAYGAQPGAGAYGSAGYAPPAQAAVPGMGAGAVAGHQAYPAGVGYATMQPQPQSQPPQKKRRGAGFWVGIIILLIALVSAIALVLFLMFGQPAKSNRAGSVGQIEGKTQQQIEEELNRLIEDGMFNISIANVVEFEDGEAEGALKIENVPNNPYLMQVDIMRDDTGETVYESGILEPNYHIQSDKLAVDLPAGAYECTAVFHALDPETEQEVGQAGAKMTIVVKS